jgi:hypothetical protein
MQKKLQALAVTVALSIVAVGANAASVLDTTTTTAITGGFTDMKDTLLGLLGVAWPFLIAVPVIMMAPRIVGKIVKMIGRG